MDVVTRNLIRNLQRAQRGMMQLNAAVQEDRDIRRSLRRLRRFLIKVGGLIAAVAISAYIKPPVGIIDVQPARMIYLAILGFNFVTGLAAVTVSMLIDANAGRPCHLLTKVVLWSIPFATVFSIGVLLASVASAP